MRFVRWNWRPLNRRLDRPRRKKRGALCPGDSSQACDIQALVASLEVLRRVKVPVVAAGGIGSGRAMATALAGGAAAVRVGTRFVAALEYEAASLTGGGLAPGRNELEY